MSAEAVGGQEYRILDTVNYELATYTQADWVRPRFSLSVEHLRQRFPWGTWFSSK